MYGYIYKTTSKIDNRVYIGQKQGGFKSNYLGSGKHFKLELLIYAKSRKELNELEKFYIQDYRNRLGKDNMFNITDGGEFGYSNKGKKGLSRFGKENPNWRGGVCSQIYKCSKCGKEIVRGSTNCKSCTGKLRNKKFFKNMAKLRGAPWNKGLTKETSSIVAHMAEVKVGKSTWNKGLRRLNVTR